MLVFVFFRYICGCHSRFAIAMVNPFDNTY